MSDVTPEGRAATLRRIVVEHAVRDARKDDRLLRSLASDEPADQEAARVLAHLDLLALVALQERPQLLARAGLSAYRVDDGRTAGERLLYESRLLYEYDRDAGTIAADLPGGVRLLPPVPIATLRQREPDPELSDDDAEWLDG